MKNKKNSFCARLMRVFALTLGLLICAVGALAAERVVINTNSRVYKTPSLSAPSFAVPKGMKLNLVAVNGSWAMVENGGVRAYMNAAHLSFLEEEAPDFSGIEIQSRPAVVLEDTYVYQRPSTSAARIAVPARMRLNLLAISGNWAMVENGGVRAYMNAAQVEALDIAVPTAAPAPTPVPAPDYSDLLENAQPARITVNTRVYQSPTTASLSVRVNAGMRVNLLAVNGSWAVIENAGVIAYIHSGSVSLITVQTPVATAAYINADTLIYQYPRTTSATIRVSAGMRVNLVAVSDGWATIENGGVLAYIRPEMLSANPPTAATPTPSPTATPEPEQPDYSDLLSSAKDAVITADTLVFRHADTASSFTGLSKGTRVRLLAVNGDWALIECSGAYGFTNVSCVSIVEQPTSTPAPTATSEPEQPDFSHLLADAKKAVLTADARVYRHADLTSSSVVLSKGTPVQLLAVNGDWALIECSGAYGFTSAALVSVLPAATPTPAPTATPVPDNYLNSDQYSNEQKIYIFLTSEIGFNRAAASGILASMYRESRFNPDIGSGSYYGLCQWGGGRRTNLTKYCNDNGYDESTLEGQLNFLHYELKKSYSKVYNYLNAVENTPDGAYSAGYYFCYHYEIPANRLSSSESRGELARDTYFPKYA